MNEAQCVIWCRLLKVMCTFVLKYFLLSQFHMETSKPLIYWFLLYKSVNTLCDASLFPPSDSHITLKSLSQWQTFAVTKQPESFILNKSNFRRQKQQTIRAQLHANEQQHNAETTNGSAEGDPPSDTVVLLVIEFASLLICMNLNMFRR